MRVCMHVCSAAANVLPKSPRDNVQCILHGRKREGADATEPSPFGPDSKGKMRCECAANNVADVLFVKVAEQDAWS